MRADIHHTTQPPDVKWELLGYHDSNHVSISAKKERFVAQPLETRKLIDLHLHFDGSLSCVIARRLGEIGGVGLPGSDNVLWDELSVGEDCADLNEYLAKFSFPLALLQMPEQLSEGIYLVQEHLKDLGLAYAELRFAPQGHGERGMCQRAVIEAALDGLGRSDFPAQLILCCMRGSTNAEANRETVMLAREYLGRGVCAVDLAGAEGLFPTSDYSDLFAYARALEVPFTIHAGEADGPESIRAALSFGAVRIGHGVRAVEDPSLLAELAERGTTLEVCPTSNIHTHAARSYADCPLRTLLDAGVRVTLNSDNMAVSNTDVRRELFLMREVFALAEAEIDQLVRNAVEASFTDEATKQRLHAATGLA